jgi:hypothetical protein
MINSMMMALCMLCCNSILSAQTADLKSTTNAIDIKKARITIESIDKQFSKDYLR